MAARVTYEVVCEKCGRKKWPTLPEKPTTYVCVLCLLPGTESRRETGRRVGFQKKSAPARSQAAPQAPREGVQT